MFWLGGLLVVAAVTIVTWGIRRRFLVVTVHGPSMTPTYRDGDRVLVCRVPGGQVAAGQVVVADLRDGVSRVVKRVAAVAGEQTPAGIDGARTGVVQPVVPPGRLVLLGDNPSASSDSRHYGYVSTDVVIGVVRRRLHDKRVAA